MNWQGKMLHTLVWAWKYIKRRKMISIRCWILEKCHPNQIGFIFLHMTWLKIGNIDDKSEIFPLHYSSFSGNSAKKIDRVWDRMHRRRSEKFLIKILLRNHLRLFKAFPPWRNGKSLFQSRDRRVENLGNFCCMMKRLWWGFSSIDDRMNFNDID